jgi:hypothetical protein
VRNPQNAFDPFEEIEQHQDAVLIIMQAAVEDQRPSVSLSIRLLVVVEF